MISLIRTNRHIPHIYYLIYTGKFSEETTLLGKDVIGLAETGSGKTGAFALPILQSLLDHPQRLFALVLTPTRELAFQISEQFEALGATIGIKCAAIVGGMDMVSQVRLHLHILAQD